MKKFFILFLWIFILYTLAMALTPQTEYEKNWPQWRGPIATGEAPHGNPPLQWSETENIRWKLALP